jgi:hypothetical protein
MICNFITKGIIPFFCMLTTKIVLQFFLFFKWKKLLIFFTTSQQIIVSPDDVHNQMKLLKSTWICFYFFSQVSYVSIQNKEQSWNEMKFTSWWKNQRKKTSVSNCKHKTFPLMSSSYLFLVLFSRNTEFHIILCFAVVKNEKKKWKNSLKHRSEKVLHKLSGNFITVKENKKNCLYVSVRVFEMMKREIH